MPRTGKPPLLETDPEPDVFDIEPEPASPLPTVEGGKRPPRMSVEDQDAVALLAAMVALFATQRISMTATGSVEYAMNDEEAGRVGAPMARIIMRHLPTKLNKSGDVADISVIATAMVAYTMRLAAIRDRRKAEQPKSATPTEPVSPLSGWNGAGYVPG